jgi:DNA-binding NtrC family response regulator
MLAQHFLQKYTTGSSQPIRGFVPDTMALLRRYHWPGNVRELENVIERAVSLAHGPLILPEDLPEAILQASEPVRRDGMGLTPEDIRDDVTVGLVTLEQLEKRYLMKVLRETGGNKVRAAKILGIDRRTLYRMAERFGLDLGEEGSNGPQ